jgi:hypothetical protein
VFVIKQIFNPKKFPMARKREKITGQKKLRYRSIRGKVQLCLVWKKNGKIHCQLVSDKRFGGKIKWSEARRKHRYRKNSAKKIDNSLTAEKVFATPTTTWKKNPNKYDVEGIDTKT